jgi:predicted RNA binding protein YcfA (HicA-like mRNA interferase family)
MWTDSPSVRKYWDVEVCGGVYRVDLAGASMGCLTEVVYPEVLISRCRRRFGRRIQRIERDGWVQVKSCGGHRQFKHPEKPGRVTISGQAGDDLAPGTWNSILKQAGLKP